MLYSELDVFIVNNTLINEDIYQYWCDGYTAQETAAFVKEKESDILGKVQDALIVSDVLDQFRQFNLIEKHLQNPVSFPNEYAFLITPKSITLLITKYYEFDDQVIREILGKKLSSKNRKDLNELSERTKVNLKSCRRQFDNIKRVFKAVEEMNGNLIANIQSQFLLPESLAQRYATVIFIANNRFETNKRKLQYLRFQDFLLCSNELMNWSCQARQCKYEGTEETLEICRYFLLSLRELKVLLEKEYLDDLRASFYREMKGSFNEKKFNELDSSFKVIVRNIINIAIGLNHSKEIKDLFIDIVEKVLEPCKQLKLNQSDMSLFIMGLIEIAQNCEPCKSNSEIRNVWRTFMRTLGNCIIKMYH